MGDVSMAGLAVATDGNELDIARAGGGDAAAGDQALAVGQQDDLEHHARVKGAGTCGVVLEACVQGPQVKFVVDQVVQCEGKTARHDLFGQHHRQHQRVVITGLVARHRRLLKRVRSFDALRFSF